MVFVVVEELAVEEEVVVDIIKHQDNMSVCFIPPYTPLLYSKTGVYRGIHYNEAVLTCTHDSCFEQK